VLRFERRLSLALVRLHLLFGYYPPRHRRRPAVFQPQWPRLGTATVAMRRTSSYPAFAGSPAAVAIRHG